MKTTIPWHRGELPSLYGGPGPGLSVGPIFAESNILRLRRNQEGKEVG